mgnify:CR=1 FL=1
MKGSNGKTHTTWCGTTLARRVGCHGGLVVAGGPRARTSAHRHSHAMCVSFNPFREHLLATGGTAAAAKALVEALGGAVEGVCVLVELGALGGAARAGAPVVSLFNL